MDAWNQVATENLNSNRNLFVYRKNVIFLLFNFKGKKINISYSLGRIAYYALIKNNIVGIGKKSSMQLILFIKKLLHKNFLPPFSSPEDDLYSNVSVSMMSITGLTNALGCYKGQAISSCYTNFT